VRYGHRQTLEPSQVKSSTGLNRDAWPLRVNDRREDRTGPYPALALRAAPIFVVASVPASIRGKVEARR
jgi:hypothetical protein